MQENLLKKVVTEINLFTAADTSVPTVSHVQRYRRTSAALLGLTNNFISKISHPAVDTIVATLSLNS